MSDAHYPGSKQLRRAVAQPAAPVVSPDSWDAKPVIKMIRGVQVELFSIGQLGKAIGRAAVTIRLWERNGVIPTARMRLTNKNGVGEFGRRYYTRPQVEAIITAAQEHGLMDRDPTKIAPSLTPEFTRDVLDAWTELEN